MRAAYVIVAAALQVGASLALKLEFNRELSVSFANKGITFAASPHEVPFDLLMDVERTAQRYDNDGGATEEDENAGVTPDGEAVDASNPDPASEDEGADNRRRNPHSQTSPRVDDCHYENEGLDTYESVSIQIVVSSALSGEELDKVAHWVSILYETAAASSYKNLQVSTVIVPGESYSTDDTATDDAYAYELLATDGEDPYAALRTFGDVYDSLEDPQLAELGCQAVFSFVNDQGALDKVLAYESTLAVDTAINFEICADGSCCNSPEQYCTALHRIDDAFLYNPMTFTREMSCANTLENGVPVIYVDHYGSRSCYCACPAGYVEDSSGDATVCKPFDPPQCECEWSKRSGYRKEVSSIPPLPPYSEGVDQCTFSNAVTDWKMPVPFPTDGYVADARDNGDVSLKKDTPRVHITVSKVSDPVYNYEDVMKTTTCDKLPHELPEYPPLQVVHEGGATVSSTDLNVSWSSYHEDRDSIIDALQFHGYGKYQLELDAFDYYGSASCPGCLAIVDGIRPKSTHACPAGVGDVVEGTSTSPDSGSACAHSAPMTKETLSEVDKRVEEYYQFDDDVENDACGENRYCNVESFKERKFYQDDYCDNSASYESGVECFSEHVVLEDFLSNDKSKENPLATSEGKCHDVEEPVTPNQCMRCCDYHTELLEWWIDYKCGYGYDTEHCSGTGADSEKCALHQCLTLDGETLATAETSIHQEIVTASENVLATLGDAAHDFDSVTQIHHALECSNYGELYAGGCTYEKTLSEMVGGQVRFSSQFEWPYGADASEYVFWRYTIPNHKDGWQLWNPYKNSDGELLEQGEVIVFDRPATTIVIEAWSQCGRVARFEYSVHLHLQSVINVCDYFDAMWYQTTVADRLDKETYCAYPGSDFAELTFDFHADTGLKNTPDRAKLTLASVSCIGSLDSRAAVTLLESNTPDADIVSRFGVEMIYNTSTKDITNFDVLCTFSYTGPNNFHTSQTCPKTFPIRDCKAPCFDTHADHCHYTECAGKETPGLYEACGGTIISADKTDTLKSTTEKQCCQGCTGKNMEVSCVSLLNLPSDPTDTQDLRRCQPMPTSSSDYGHGHGHDHDHGHGHGHGHYQTGETTETEAATDSTYASPYDDTESTTTTTTTEAYDLLAATSLKRKTSGGGDSYRPAVTTTSASTYDNGDTASTTAYGPSGTPATATPCGSADAFKDKNKGGGLIGGADKKNKRAHGKDDKDAKDGEDSEDEAGGSKTAYDNASDASSTETQSSSYASATAATAYGLLASASSAAQEHPQVMALLGSSAFIAVVALVVVKRRADAIRKEQLENDVYYPLLH